MIGYLLVAIIGILVFLVFLQGPLQLLLKNTFCYFYQNVLQQSSSLCPKATSQLTYVPISGGTPEDVALNISAYSIACLENYNPQTTQNIQNIICYTLLLQNISGNVSELMMTQIMERDGGCQALQNSMIVLQNGTYTSYPGNCGTEDDILWNVTGNVINQQTSIVLIKYDVSLKKIMIEA